MPAIRPEAEIETPARGIPLPVLLAPAHVTPPLRITAGAELVVDPDEGGARTFESDTSIEGETTASVDERPLSTTTAGGELEVVARECDLRDTLATMSDLRAARPQRAVPVAPSRRVTVPVDSGAPARALREPHPTPERAEIPPASQESEPGGSLDIASPMPSGVSGRRTGRRVAVVTAVVVVSIVGDLFLVRGALALHERWSGPTGATGQTVQHDQEWLDERARAGAEVARAEFYDTKRPQVESSLVAARDTLARSEGTVDEALRQQLAAAIDATSLALTNEQEASTWLNGARDVVALQEAVEQEIAEAKAAADAAAAAAAQVAADAAAQEAEAAREQKPTSPEPTRQQPAQSGEQAPAAGVVSRIEARLSSSTGKATITVTVTTTGAVSVTPAANVGGVSVALSGPGVVEGSATFTGSVTGLAAGDQPWTASAGGLTTSGTVPVF